MEVRIAFPKRPNALPFVYFVTFLFGAILPKELVGFKSDKFLAPHKLGWALFEKRFDAFRVIVREPRGGDREALRFEQHFERRNVHRLEHFLGKHQRIGCRGRQFQRQRAGFGLELAVGHHFHYDAHLLRFRRGQLACGIHQLLGARDAEVLREQEYRAAVGRQADLLERHHQVGGFGSDDKVARERNAGADAGGGPAHRGNHRLFQVVQALDHALMALRAFAAGKDIAVAHGADVATRAERTSRADHDYAARSVVAAERGKGFGKLVVHLAGQGVQLVGAIERHGRDAVFFGDYDGHDVYSAFTPANLITLAHFSISLRRKTAYWSSVLPTGSEPSAVKRSLSSGECTILITSELILAMISRGVLAGAPSPFHATASKPLIPASSMVARSGKAFERCMLVTASARSLPPLISGNAEVTPLKMRSMWPPARSMSAGALPL